ncbi:MAG: hypothetical protein EOO43_12205 [Flavobacterium sp.]|nr:MAG: hypothetical protein EOO43_12205 [Flavobacterium sp.]
MNDLRERYKEFCYRTRGEILDNLAFLELSMDLYIADHFTDSSAKLEEMISLIITPRVTLDGKRAIMKRLVEDYDEPFRTKYPKFNGDLKDIIEKRNYFAHYPTIFIDEKISTFSQEKFINLGKFKEGNVNGERVLYTVITFTEPEIETYLKKIKKYRQAIMGTS